MWRVSPQTKKSNLPPIRAAQIHSAQQYPGASTSERIDACISDVARSNGICVLPGGMQPGAGTTNAENVALWDFRQTERLVGNPGGYSAIFMHDSHAGGGAKKVFGAAFQVHASSGGNGNLAAGEAVGLFAGAERTGGGRPIWAFNSVARIAPGFPTNGAASIEADLDNDSGRDAQIDNRAENQQFGLKLVSGGANKPLMGISITSSGERSVWKIGQQISNYETFGLKISGPQTSTESTANLYLVPTSDDDNLSIVGRNSQDRMNVYRINNDGSAQFAHGKFKIDADGSIELTRLSNNGGVKHGRSGRVLVEAGARSEVFINWTPVFADGNYTVTCSVEDTNSLPTSQGLIGERVHTKSAMRVGFIVSNPTTNRLPAIVDCRSEHD